ncbi:MAG: glycosyltransferase family 4 protein [Chloroflexales bacterium]|nr:glycosyltransferase family 4 protein [Chloroflexales bacterium]
MKRLNILIWHIHGSYLNALGALDHNWYLPVMPDGTGRRGPAFVGHERMIEVPAAEVQSLDLDLIIFQSPKNYEEDQFAILSEEQRHLPKIYLEHNTPRPHPTDSRHVVDDSNMLLVHVTHFNRLMWDNGRTPTTVIEHSVLIDPAARYTGARREGVMVVNGMQKRPRIAGYDIFLYARERVPLTCAGMETAQLGGLGDMSYRTMHHVIGEHRFLFSPMRYTSLPLAVIEALTLGVPVVALATTELPTVIEDGVHGYLSCDIDALVERMRYLLDNPAEANRLGANARRLAEERFGIERFKQDWNRAFRQVAG